MKCPNCSYDQKVKYGLKCSGCGYRFTFNPKERETFQMTDGRFIACVRAAGQNGTSYFTKNQLYETYCRRQKFSRWPKFLGAAFFSFIAIMLYLGGGLVGPWFIPGGIAIVLLQYGLIGRATVFSKIQFMKMIDNWLADGKEIDHMVSEPMLHHPPPNWKESDIYDYGVEQILIVQHDSMVDLFVLNNAHAEQRALVISESGYPNYLMPHARRLLEERSDLPVYFLHDADREGMNMESRIRKMDLPLQERKLIDLGMRTTDFERLKRTENFDRRNRRRELPVDALPTAFLLTGLGACFANEATLSDLLDEHVNERAIANQSSSFG